MKRLVKRILLATIILVVLSFATAYVLAIIYKDDISNSLLTGIEANYSIKASVGAVKISFFDNWPHASVEFKKVSIRSSLAPKKSPDVLVADKIALAFNLRQLFQGKIILKQASVSNATITLKRDLQDSSNFKFRKAPNAVDGGQQLKLEFDIKQLNLRNSVLDFENLAMRQHVRLQLKNEQIKFQHADDGAILKINGRINCEQFVLDTRQGSFAEGAEMEVNAKVIWRKDLETILVYPGSEVRILQEHFPITLLYKYTGNRQLAIVYSDKAANFKVLRGLLSPRMREALAAFDVKNRLSIYALIVASPGKHKESFMDIRFSSQNQSLLIGNSKVPYSDLNFEGRVLSCDSTHLYGDLERATVTIPAIKGRVHGLPFTASLTVCNLRAPFLSLVAGLQVNAADLDFKVAKDFVLQGNMVADIRYNGPMSKVNKHEFLDAPMQLKANLRFKNLSYREFNKRHAYIVNGLAKLNNRDVYFDSLRLKTIVGNAKLSGKAQNFVPYLLGYANGFKARVNASSELIDLNPLLSGQPSNKEIKKDKQKSKTAREKINAAELGHFDFAIQLSAKKLIVRKVIAESLKGDLSYKNNFVQLRTFSANSCQGRISGNIDISDFTTVKGHIAANDMDVTTMFVQFENFGQDAIKAEQLRGNITAGADIHAELSDNFEIIPGSLNADVSLKLRDGHLLNFEPLQKLSNLVFKNRNFRDISFSELNENFHIDGFRMTIEELEVASSVLNFYVVDGLYNFRGVSNINLLLPWSNLKRRKRDELPSESGISASDTKGIKLNYRGPKQAMKVSFGHQSSQGL